MKNNLGKIVANVETATRAHEFTALARTIAASASTLEALQRAETQRLSPRVATVLKAAVSAGSFASGNWGEPLGELDTMVAAFLGSLRNFGAFDRMLPSMKRVPLRTRLGLVTTGATGAVVPAAQVKLVSQLTLTGNQQLTEYKAVALLAISAELARLPGDSGNTLFADELRRSIAVTTDEQFLSLITGGITPSTSNGGTSIAILQDLADAFDAVDTDSASSLFIIVSPTIAKAWSTKTTATGEVAFPQMGPQGGTMCNVPVLVTDAVSAQIIVADAHQIVAATGGIELDRSTQADLQLDTAPNSPPDANAAMTSLWRHDLVGVKATRYFGAIRLGATGVAVVDGVGYTGNSPA